MKAVACPVHDWRLLQAIGKSADSAGLAGVESSGFLWLLLAWSTLDRSPCKSSHGTRANADL